jgi:DNA-binding MarR family transcriptional regulator
MMRRRRRSACLAVLEHLRATCSQISLTDAVTFLYVCENEGINIRELAHLASLSPSTASRSCRRLADQRDRYAIAPALGLLRLQPQERDGRGRILRLTERGLVLRERLNGLVVAATPILI